MRETPRSPTPSPPAWPTSSAPHPTPIRGRAAWQARNQPKLSELLRAKLAASEAERKSREVSVCIGVDAEDIAW